MRLEDIEDWEDIQKYLELNFEDSERRHRELVDYQQDLAGTKYRFENPMEKWNYSFIDTLEYFKNSLK